MNKNSLPVAYAQHNLISCSVQSTVVGVDVEQVGSSRRSVKYTEYTLIIHKKMKEHEEGKSEGGKKEEEGGRKKKRWNE